MLNSFVTTKDISTFDKLIDESRFHISSPAPIEEIEKLSKMKNKYNLLTIIDNGYSSLPKPYYEAFLDPLKNLILNQDFDTVLETYGGEGTLLEDWIACIDQRSRKYDKIEMEDLSAPTMAFTELCADVYDGYVSRSVRKDALLPESQLLAPLTKWGGGGAYTHSVRAGLGIGMKASIINLPVQYSKNIALWPLSVHECYHDVVEAYSGLLNEVEERISEDFESNKMRKAFENEKINWNGKEDMSISEFASEYWRRTMSETLADICGILNIGPAAGISFAVLALAQGSKDIVPKSYIDDPHPNDVLRIKLAVEVIAHLNGVAINIRNAYIAFLNQLIAKYVHEKNKLVLYCNDLDGNKIDNIIVPFKVMEKTVQRVVELVAFTRLKALGNHSLYELNTWTNRDEVLVQRIALDLLNIDNENQIPNLEPGPDNQEVFAAHIVSAATLALVKKPKIEEITKLAIKSLCKLYQANPMWRGLSVQFRSDVELHDVSKFNNKNLLKGSKSGKTGANPSGSKKRKS